jgi:hypothetical protein
MNFKIDLGMDLSNLFGVIQSLGDKLVPELLKFHLKGSRPEENVS